LTLVAVVCVLLLLSQLVGAWVATVDLDVSTFESGTLHAGVWMTATLYAVLLAVPFVPGVEIGIGLMAMLGSASALPVYVATVMGLSIAFAVGRMVPVALLIRAATAMRMKRLAAMMRRMAPLPPADRLDLMLQHAPGGWAGWLIRHRYLALVILINLPGNALIGGGGGIALVAGMCRLISPPGFVLTIALAVSPIPLVVWFFGADVLGALV